MPVSSTAAITGLSGQQHCHNHIDPLTCCEVSQTLIPLSSIPIELNLSLNCVTVSCSSSNGSSLSSPNSISSGLTTNPNSCEPQSQLTIITSRIGNDSEGVVKIEEAASSEEIDDDDFRDNLEKVLNLSGKGQTENGYSAEECDLDFDEFDDILDENDYVHCDIVSSTSSANSITLYSGTSDSESSSSRRKRHFSGDPDGYGDGDVESECEVIIQSDGHNNGTVEDNSEFLSLDNPNALPCLYCQGGKDHTDPIWPIQLDLDLLKTLFQLCPDFFDDFDEVEMDPTELNSTSIDDPSTSSSSLDNTQLLQSSSSTSTTATSSSSGGPESSPPHVIVDDSPLQQSMDRNKESLKVKLLLRRPMNQLVEQGILPPPKTPAAFAGQRVRFERARMGDLLKAKIQQRPARQELIRQHILEDSNARVAPSLAERQRMLKRARLADSLNDHLIHRPGPLELVQKNILHAPDVIEQAIKEGVVPFKCTSEGHVSGPQLPFGYNSEDDSSSDMSSPADTPDQSQASKSVSSSSPQSVAPIPSPIPAGPSISMSTASSSMPSPTTTVTTTVQPPPPHLQVVTPTQQIQNQILSRIVQAAVTSSTIPPVTSAQLTLNKLSQLDPQQLSALMSSMAAQQQGNAGQGGRAFMTPQGISFSPQFQQQQHASTSKSRSSKKSSKTKSQPKARQIKFHEYKGPPSAQKCLPPTQSPQSESSYELLLQQQQLFLQWQLEWQHKYPQIILPVVSKLNSPTEATGKLTSAISAAAAVSMHSHTSPTMATATNPIVLSPSTISAVSNIGTLISSPVTQSGISIAPTPQASVAAQTFVFEKCPSTPSIQNASPIPFSVMMTSSSSTSALELRPTPAIISKAQISTSCIEEIQPVKIEIQAPLTATKVTSPITPITKPVTGTPNLNMAKLNDWKVSDLKAELKKRNLPVSGAKPQLIDRLKSSDLTLQDESISTTTHSNNTNTTLKNNNNRLQSTTIIKNEVQIVDSCSTDDMMDVNESSATNTQSQQENIRKLNQNSEKQGNANTNTTLNAAMIALLGKNNIKNNGGVIPIHVFNALTKVTTTNNVNSNSGELSDNNKKGNSNNVIVVDEVLIREQQKQIEQLQDALKNSQQQLQQMKLSQQGGGQKHRLALQQHLQHKMQQQALQAQLQKLIQLHSLQQQQQQELAQPAKTQIAQIQLGQKSQPQPQPQKIQISPKQEPQRAVAVSKDKSSNQQHTNKSTSNNVAKIVPTSKLPFTVVKISTATRTCLMTADNSDGDLDNIPQLQIPETNNSAFQIGKNESCEGSNSISDTSNNSDQMDHSWLLKINEVQPEDSDSTNGIVKTYPSLFESVVVNGFKENERQPAAITPANAKSAKGFKSQMVDDVLEILIRNGELPPSAAQEPQTPTTPGKSPKILTYPSAAPSLNNAIPPPPPPPLPPVTFAVTLPTSITFSRPTAASLTNSFLPLQVTLPAISSNAAEAKSSTLSSVISSLTHQPHIHLTNTEALTKEAQDILKISEDLSNFGRAHAENENQNRLLSSRIQCVQEGHNRIHDEDNSNALAILLGEVEKDLQLVDDMDVVLDDQSSQDFPISSESNRQGFTDTSENSNGMPMSIDSRSQHSNLHLIINGKHSSASDDLLDELGTLLPSDLDVPMPMEMDYSDWLDNLLPENNNSSSESVHMNTNSTSEACNMITTTDISDSSGNGSCNNNFYSVMMDFNSDQFGQRDPLLSSRSLNIFTSSSMPENPNSSLSTSSMDMKSINRAPSPMAMGDNGLLWDFV